MNRENDREEELMYEETTTTLEYDHEGTVRINALAFALNHHGNLQAGTADEVVVTAQKFFDFLVA